MKVKIVALSKTDWFDDDDDEYEFYGLEPGGVYEVVSIYEEIESMVIKNKNDRNVVVYNNEVERYED